MKSEWIYVISMALLTHGASEFKDSMRMEDVWAKSPHYRYAHGAHIALFVFLIWGFVVFKWYIPLVGLVLAPVILHFVIQATGMKFRGFEQWAIIFGGIGTFVELLHETVREYF